METTLIFHGGLDLPHFAAFVLLDEERGIEALRDYYLPYVELARTNGVGLILDTPTWRANPDWGDLLGYSREALVDVNRRGVELLAGLRTGLEGEFDLVISGCVGPRGDGYRAGDLMTPSEAERYHALQIDAFAGAEADLVTALTLTYAAEAVGIVRAAEAAAMPVAVSFTVETDGRLPNGVPLGEAVTEVDDATDGAAVYFMINCAHPTHFAHVLEDGGPWVERIRGLRANASAKSHAELDESEELDEGDPLELAHQYRSLARWLPNLTVVGGCCGTDERHVGAICSAWLV